MNLEDFLNGNNGIDANADTLPQVYGLDDDTIVNKTKRLVKGAFECDRDHEVIELIRAEADSDIEAVILAHLVNKFILEQVMEQSQDVMNSLAFTLAMGLVKANKRLGLTDEQSAELLEVITEAIDNAKNQ